MESVHELSSIVKLVVINTHHKFLNMSEKLHLLIDELTIAARGNNVPIILVDTLEKLTTASQDLATYDRFAFDTEGVDLSRTGELTVATIQGFQSKKKETPIYVIDVQILGCDVAYSKDSLSLRSILEDPSKEKVTFDCRSDSDALFHQFGVSLNGTFDLQIFDQAVRIHNGETPPKRNPYVCNGGVPFLSDMETVSKRYSIEASLNKSTAPHRSNINIWKQRPLSSTCIQYAANDVHVIKQLWYEMSNSDVSNLLMQRTIEHSRRYESMFRDRAKEVKFYLDKEFVMEEHAIVTESELPADHPRNMRDTPSYTIQKWNKAIAALESRTPNAYNDVIFILQHDDWYTDAGRNEMKRLATKYPFTSKQRFRIANPPSLVTEEEYEDYEDYEEYEEFGDYRDYW